MILATFHTLSGRLARLQLEVILVDVEVNIVGVDHGVDLFAALPASAFEGAPEQVGCPRKR
jgi:hypothetical protein